ncbi:MAG TPA: type II toxin-antitoxin system VapC family toxin [Bryobacteraceae bacterium]|nr:type II toxin-antitoxin system VapC family toxin [Bryobacteraceae bacterium]
MSLVYWDTMLFAYLFEAHPEFTVRVAQIARRMQERGDTLCTSVFAVGEMLAGPSRTQRWDEVSKVREFFRSPELRLLDFKLSTAEIFAEIRGRGGISPGDAIHLSSAAEARVDLFLTHDKQLARKIIPGIQFIATLDTNVL